MLTSDSILYYLKIYAVIFPVLVLYFYLIPSGGFYYFFYLKEKRLGKKTRIQQRKPSGKAIKREIISSLKSLAFFSLMTLIIYEAWKRGQTAIYTDISEYPLGYTIMSFFLLILLHDTYHYWAHRFMHWKPVYKYIHKEHHRSVTPTAWATFTFQPLEMVLQFGIFMLIAFFVPAHPVVLLLFVSYDNFVNAGGHAGHEFVPAWMKKHWFFKWNNCVEHHDLHHSKFNYNYGLYFNVWDRLMGTFMEVPADDPAKD